MKIADFFSLGVVAAVVTIVPAVTVVLNATIAMVTITGAPTVATMVSTTIVTTVVDS